MKKQCLECGEPLQGRVDKRFCGDYCRNTYHNRSNRGASTIIRQVNRVLRENRRILAELNTDGKRSVPRTWLLDRGFQFGYFTNEYLTQTGNVYRFCYDQGYLVSDREFVTLVVRKERRVKVETGTS